MAVNQVERLTPRHDLIIDFLIANPTMKMSDVARTFGVTPPWLSVIIHSDIFQAKLAEKQEVFFIRSTQSIKEKLETLAHLAIDDMIDRVEVQSDINNVREIAKVALDRIGFSPARGPVVGGNQYVQNNFISASAEVLKAARQKILEHKEHHAGALVESTYLPAAEGL